MTIEPDEFRRHYEELSDEGLLSIPRHELAEHALRFYDEELARRGLRARPDPGVEIAEKDEDLTAVATFLFADEAGFARALLQSASIRCYLANEYTLSIMWTWNYAVGGLRLMVPISAVDEAKEIFEIALSDDERWSESEPVTAPGPPGKEEKFSMARIIDPMGRGRRRLLWLLIFLFCDVDVYRLYLFFVW